MKYSWIIVPTCETQNFFSENISGNRQKKKNLLSYLVHPLRIQADLYISQDNPFVCGTASHGPPCQPAFMVHDTQPHPTHMHNHHLSQTQAELAL